MFMTRTCPLQGRGYAVPGFPHVYERTQRHRTPRRLRGRRRRWSVSREGIMPVLEGGACLGPEIQHYLHACISLFTLYL